MRVILLILDGLGVGAMSDVNESRPQDKNANTLLHVAEAVGGFDLPNLSQLGLGWVAPASGLQKTAPPLASYGRANLGYDGADSYLGHQELLGTVPKSSQLTLFCEVSAEVESVLKSAGYEIRRYQDDSHILIVNDTVVIADNMEADPGQNINITVPIKEVDFEFALAIGQVVRDAVKVARVIVFGGPDLTHEKILQSIEKRANGQHGVLSPPLEVYDERLVVRHLGYGVDPNQQVASILADQGYRVSLAGKMADLIVCPSAERDGVVPTDEVMDVILGGMRNDTFDFIAATVQETDLAGHQGDSERVYHVLCQVDHKLSELLPLLNEEDVLIISADHGNDPTLGLGKHTREQVPVLIYQPGKPSTNFRDRDCLADIAATISAVFDVPMPQDGEAILFNE